MNALIEKIEQNGGYITRKDLTRAEYEKVLRGLKNGTIHKLKNGAVHWLMCFCRNIQEWQGVLICWHRTYPIYNGFNPKILCRFGVKNPHLSLKTVFSSE